MAALEEIIEFANRTAESLKRRICDEDMKTWIERCKEEVKLTKAKHLSVEWQTGVWVDDCEDWFSKTAKKEGANPSIADTTCFRELIGIWIEDAYEKQLEEQLKKLKL